MEYTEEEIFAMIGSLYMANQKLVKMLQAQEQDVPSDNSAT